jgi:3',5'-cyclic AMP phosphodiesterase CpdA
MIFTSSILSLLSLTSVLAIPSPNTTRAHQDHPIPHGSSKDYAFEPLFDNRTIIAIGDVHSDFNKTVEVLQMTGIIDHSQFHRWKAYNHILVFTGDYLDRGNDPIQVLRLLMRLEREARKFGSEVHLLLGNHEIMNLQGLEMKCMQALH